MNGREHPMKKYVFKSIISHHLRDSGRIQAVWRVNKLYRNPGRQKVNLFTIDCDEILTSIYLTPLFLEFFLPKRESFMNEFRDDSAVERDLISLEAFRIVLLMRNIRLRKCSSEED